MSFGMTIAEFVQQVYYDIYKVILDVRSNAELPEAFHSTTNKFQEVVFEGNIVLQEIQKEQDWGWLRDRLELGYAQHTHNGRIMEFTLPQDVYKPATGYNDAVRLHNPHNMQHFVEVPFTQARSGTVNNTLMHDSIGRINTPDNRLRAFQVGNEITFTRPFNSSEVGCLIETDVIRRLMPLHICDDKCVQPCPKTYEEKVFTEIPDPHYVVARTAMRRAEGDPSASDRVLSLTDEATKMLSAMRENDSSKTFPDTYRTSELGYVSVL